VSGTRLLVGIVVMGIAVPVVLLLLLGLRGLTALFTISAVTFLSWGIADLLATILEKPRLADRSPGRALREDLNRRAEE
jgi:hypothetical protein